MNDTLIEQLKAKIPDFSDPKKLDNLEARATKLHEIEGKYSKRVFNNLSKALTEIEAKLKDKHKLAKELCRAATGTFTIVFELPVAESKKKLETALQTARNEYENWISNQQTAWLDNELKEALAEQAQANAEKEQQANDELKSALLKALQSD